MTLGMTRSPARTNFHSSTLLRQLNQLAVVDLLEPGYAVAERLATWMTFNDAMALSAAQSAVTSAQGKDGDTAGLEAGLSTSIFATQQRIAQLITKRCALDSSDEQMPLPRPPTGVALEIAVSYEPYLRFYLALQREMAANIQKLRSAARAGLESATHQHQVLVALDKAMAGFIDERERTYLGRLPLVLEQRFMHLRKNHLATLAETNGTDDPNDWIKPGQWLAVFCEELRSVLLAELDFRMQSVLGLLEALNTNSN
jgi:Protein of unknown function (DUF3348)